MSELFRRLAQQEDDAATEVVSKYQQRLLRLVASHLNQKLRSRVDPEDLVQSILKSAFRVAGEGHQEFQDDTGFWKWLVSVALNKTYNRIDREMAQKRTPDREIGGDFDERLVIANTAKQMPSSSEVVTTAELLESILEQLSDRQQQVLLGRLDGYSQKEIAARCERDTKTIQRDWKAIREVARKVLGDAVPPSFADE